MRTHIRAILVGGKDEFESTYTRLRARMAETFGIFADWDPHGRCAITTTDYDLVLISADVTSHLISEKALEAARDAHLPVQHITRGWGETCKRLEAKGYTVLPDGPPLKLVDDEQPVEKTLPGEVDALIEQLVDACDRHQIPSLLFDLKANELEWEQVTITAGRSALRKAS